MVKFIASAAFKNHNKIIKLLKVETTRLLVTKSNNHTVKKQELNLGSEKEETCYKSLREINLFLILNLTYT